jgi:hypothetical protein
MRCFRHWRSNRLVRHSQGFESNERWPWLLIFCTAKEADGVGDVYQKNRAMSKIHVWKLVKLGPYLKHGILVCFCFSWVVCPWRKKRHRRNLHVWESFLKSWPHPQTIFLCFWAKCEYLLSHVLTCSCELLTFILSCCRVIAKPCSCTPKVHATIVASS